MASLSFVQSPRVDYDMVWKKIMTRRGAEKDRNETRESPQFEEKCAEKNHI